jgi:isopenicillin N synthase-like dioxygenase
MTTSFSSLPIIDLQVLSSPSPSPSDLITLSKDLHDAFATTGFAYLANAPLSFDHEDVFRLASDFFSLPGEEKMRLAKQTFCHANKNTYRGYFPTQPGQQDNLKEGVEVGPKDPLPHYSSARKRKFDLAEPNVWPSSSTFGPQRTRLESLYAELQHLSSTLLSLLAVSLDKPADHFAHYLKDSLSTLRLLHYPPQPSATSDSTNQEPKLCCTPHTDSGILTLLHQDPTGGLEVLNAEGQWVPAPYVPETIVVNIGDLLAQVSGGKFVATKHRVRTNSGGSSGVDGMGRFSVPFFFEPGEACVVQSIEGDESVVYGDYVRAKMGTWVEYQDDDEIEAQPEQPIAGVPVEAY